MKMLRNNGVRNFNSAVGRSSRLSISGRIASFTLIELLVVIAIIAILAGMLLPALNRAKDSAQTSGCINNIKQLGMSLFGYEMDYNQLPSISSNGNPALTVWLYDLYSNGYLKNCKILFCPLSTINTIYPNREYADPKSATNCLLFPESVWL